MIRQLLVVWAAIGMVWYALNVPAEQVELTKRISNGHILESGLRSNTLVGGFPWRYCEFANTEALRGVDVENREIFKSRASLNWNIAIGVVLAGGLGALIVLADRRKQKAAAESDGIKKGGLQVSLSGLLITITVVAGLLGYYRFQRRRLLDDLNAFAHKGGRASASMVAPRWLGNAIDVSFAMRPERASLNCRNCSETDFRRISKMRSLTSLTATAASTDQICAIAALPNLKRISLYSFELTDTVRDALRANRSIHSFSLSPGRTTTNDELRLLFQAISDRPGPRSLALTLTAVPDQPVQLQGIRGLTALTIQPPPQPDGTPAIPIAPRPIRISGLPEVISLTNEGLGSGATEPEENYADVILADLPDLENLSFHVRLSSLKLEQVPKLSTLGIELGVRDKLELDNLASLASIQFGNPFPKNLSLQKLPALKYKNDDPFGVHFSGRFGSISRASGITMQTTLTAKVADALGEHVSELVLPPSMTVAGLFKVLPKLNVKKIDFSEVLFAADDQGVDFDAMPDIESLESISRIGSWRYLNSKSRPELYQLLAKTPNLRQLSVGSDFTDAHVPLLASLTQLEIFEAEESAVTDKGWKLMARMSNLKHLSIPQKLENLELHDLEHLETLQWQQARLKSLRLENLPALKLGLDINSNLQSLSIKNCGELEYVRMLVLPKDFELEDTMIRALQVNDETFNDEQLAKFVSPQTEQLLLNNTGITSASLDLLLSLKKLKVLDISATDLTEADVKRLVAEANLEHLNAQLIFMSEETLKTLPQQPQRAGLQRGVPPQIIRSLMESR